MDLKRKKLIPAFGCRDGRAVIIGEGHGHDGGEDAASVCYYGDDILTLSRYYSDNGADELLICDLSETDADHERTIDLIREMARSIDVPIIAGGRVRRLEDVKKYLYAGAKAVYLIMSEAESADMLKEASDRFGSEKIYAYMPGLTYLKRAKEYAGLGASAAILDVLMDEKDFAMLKDCPLPVLGVCAHDADETIYSYLKSPCAGGVILPFPDNSEENCMSMKQELKKQGIPMETLESSVEWREFKLNSDGLIPVIVQDYRTLEVLMMAYMNEEAFHITLQSGKMTYFSRSRQSLWTKGETSGHFQYVKSLSLDCDNDTILARVKQVGAACHTGNRSCFFKTLTAREYRENNPLKVFEKVFRVILDRKEHPREGSYTNYLFDKGLDKILKKLGEEASEIIIAAKNPNPEEVKYEISDFLYHMMVLMAQQGVTWEDITEELARR